MPRTQPLCDRDSSRHSQALRRPWAGPDAPADLRSQAEEVLREVAFVLHLARSITNGTRTKGDRTRMALPRAQARRGRTLSTSTPVLEWFVAESRRSGRFPS